MEVKNNMENRRTKWWVFPRLITRSGNYVYPLVILHSYWNLPFIAEFPLDMLIFHSYVSLLEGNYV